LDGAPGAAGAPEVVTRIGEGLVREGVAVDRIAAFVATLHPSVAARGFEWTPGTGTRVLEFPYDLFRRDQFAKNPMGRVVREGVEVRGRIDPEASGPREYSSFDDLAKDGFRDYLGLPMVFTSGERQVITFATKAAAGFAEEDLAALRRITRPLSRLAEILALRRTASNLLSTYVGHGSGDRILAGRIQRGDIETIRAVIWFSDLRGFTELSSRLTPREVIDIINRVFECQVPSIEKRRGEVLKFIGDGMLAIFPLAEGEEPRERAQAALEAALEAQAAVGALEPHGEHRLRIGIGLHVGEVAYGNIGGANRLDFTAIGAAVNLCSRIEGASSKLGRPVVLSGDLAAHLTAAGAAPLDDLGEVELKGVGRPVRVFAPR